MSDFGVSKSLGPDPSQPDLLAQGALLGPNLVQLASLTVYAFDILI